MIDPFGRTINYLRISVTDRCNLRCVYCCPAEGIRLISHDDILSYEEILEFVRVAVASGINKVRLTGGEPLVRKGVLFLVERLAQMRGINDVAMSTNGILLEQFAQPLARAGLRRVNVSLDAVSPRRYREITRCGDVRKVLAGIAAARAAGLTPVKLNCVVEQSSEEPDAREVSDYAQRNGLEIRFIRRMDLATGCFWPVKGGAGGLCKQCNRLRLSSDGMLRPCLFNDIVFSVRALGPAEALKAAVAHKPESGGIAQANEMHSIGG